MSEIQLERRPVTDDGERDAGVERSTLRKITWRLLPLLGLGYAVAYVDRINISFAALQMNADLHFSDSIYGLGAGLFSLSYCLLEIPSNLLLSRFGARRWITRIMLTWGLLAVGMMFVRTPLQFYMLRFLLGAAEAGFFPGVLFYLKQWFPPTHSGRAISRFYIAVPLGAAFMGAISGPLLHLGGLAGLAGWQWLFLVEGVPAILLSAILFLCLADSPAHATWLDAREREWLLSKLAGNNAVSGDSRPTAGLLGAMSSPEVWRLGLSNFLILGSNYAFALSAPRLLRDATHWDATPVGFIMSGAALLGAGAMLLNGWHSDRHGERHAHVAAPLCLMAAALTVIAWTHSPWLVVSAYAAYYIGSYAVQAAFWPIPSNALRGATAAVGLAAIGSLGMFGGFLGPWAWGRAKDLTGSYRAGLIALSLVYVATAAFMMLLRLRNQPLMLQRAR
jgi:ACS family tartrate transporter-like MFS transporter